MTGEKTAYVVANSPHVTSPTTTRGIMLDVLVALAPATVAGVVFFGAYALFTLVLCVGCCVLFEALWCLLRKQPLTISDGSAAVTGLILGLNLPPAVPFYVPILGSLFAIVLVKMLFGGLGKNFANPAAAARVFLLLSFATVMTRYFIAPIDYGAGESFFNFNLFRYLPAGADIDAVTSATPLGKGNADLLALFLGNYAGCIGETSVLCLLLGGAYLLIRRVIDWRIPVCLLGTVALFTLVFYGKVSEIPVALLSGGVMLGALFMATDYTTSPNGRLAQVVFAVLVGFFTVFLRRFSSMPEGMSFAILLGNVVAPYLDQLMVPRPFGYVPKRRRKKKEEATAADRSAKKRLHGAKRNLRGAETLPAPELRGAEPPRSTDEEGKRI